MIALSITDMKTFTGQLFLQESFDAFLVTEVVVTTGTTTAIDGRIQKDFYTEEELSGLPDQDFALWQGIRPFCFQLIKGKRLPKSFRIVLALPKGQIARLIREKGLAFSPEQIGGLYLNIRYEKGALHLVTGTSLTGFSMDRSLEQEWDASVKAYLKQHDIAFEEI